MWGQRLEILSAVQLNLGHLALKCLLFRFWISFSEEKRESKSEISLAVVEEMLQRCQLRLALDAIVWRYSNFIVCLYLSRNNIFLHKIQIKSASRNKYILVWNCDLRHGAPSSDAVHQPILCFKPTRYATKQITKYLLILAWYNDLH